MAIQATRAHFNRILSVPLSSRLPEDRFIWAYTAKGNFTVKNAYKVTLSSSLGPVARSSDGHDKRSFWKSFVEPQYS